ncbi:MAG: ABC transporter ATP-binding protein, partial [bacterium]|nr:ABC transporter ATP-binding protein [bacterium]
MIRVEHLKKEYISKNKIKSRGIVDVSFTLPSTGFVFVLGKSGSGKSTLLNLLGTLDKKTDGKIYIDNKDLDTFKKDEIDYYRSSYCGFIFQDYQLIDELTVKENISIALEINDDNDEKEKRVQEIINDLELNGLENKFTNELSGGQKQRVSIARALIKKPKLILCDEPTGNLDKKTSLVIMNLLKKISSDCLVFMVTHDENSSLIYADRRIILEEGLIIKDEYRSPSYKNEFYIENEVAFLPFNKQLSEEECLKLNEELSNGKVKRFKNINNGFSPFENTIEEENDDSFRAKSNKFNKKSLNKLTKIYFKKNLFASIFTTTVLSLLTILVILIQTLLSFDASRIYLDNINQEMVIASKIDTKDPIEQVGCFLHLSSNDEEKIFSNNDKIYKVFNYTPYVFGNQTSAEEGYFRTLYTFTDSNPIYPTFFNGTAVVDDDFLFSAYNVSNENKENIIAGSLDDTRDSLHVIITDFMADAILNVFQNVYPDYDYEDLIGPLYIYQNHKFSDLKKGYIGCIIKTNYKEKYKKIIDLYEQAKKENFKKEIIEEIVSLDEYVDYCSEFYYGRLSL